MSPFEVKILLASTTRVVVADVNKKSQEIYDCENIVKSRNAVECCIWLKADLILFASAAGVFLWRLGQNEKPQLLFQVPNSIQYHHRGISTNSKNESIVVSLLKRNDEVY